MRCLNTTVGFAAAALLALGACTLEGEPTTTAENLDLTESTEQALAGTIQVEDLDVKFNARQTQDQVFAIEMRYGDVTFTGEYDYKNETFLLDGYVTATGADIVVDDTDLLVIDELGSALSAAKLNRSYRPDVKNQRGVVRQTPGSAMSRLLAVWKARGVGVAPEHYIQAEHGRTINYLCGWLTGYGLKATHDCWDCWDYWDGWNYVNIGPQGAYDCYPDSCNPSCSNYNVNRCGKLSCEQSGGGASGTWQWGSNSDKYGACTVWDTNAYTLDCLHHDHCVRNDHGTLSGWCSDDAVPAGDDQASANDCIMNNGCSNNCGGYSSSGGCYCDAACESYGDCCMDKVQKCG